MTIPTLWGRGSRNDRVPALRHPMRAGAPCRLRWYQPRFWPRGRPRARGTGATPSGSATTAARKDRSRSRKRPPAELGSGPTCRPRATWPAYGRPVKFKPTPCRAPTGCCQSRSGARRTCAPLVCAEFSDPRTLNRGFRRPIPLEPKACCFDAKGRVLEGLVRPAFCL